MKRSTKPGGGGIEQCTQYSRSCLLEFKPELPLVAAHLGLHVEELYDHCAVEKVGPRGTEVGIALNTKGRMASKIASSWSL